MKLEALRAFTASRTSEWLRDFLRGLFVTEFSSGEPWIHHSCDNNVLGHCCNWKEDCSLYSGYWSTPDVNSSEILIWLQNKRICVIIDYDWTFMTSNFCECRLTCQKSSRLVLTFRKIMSTNLLHNSNSDPNKFTGFPGILQRSDSSRIRIQKVRSRKSIRY